MARDRPDCAITASLLASALVKTTSVATTTSVVLARAVALVTGSSASGGKAWGRPRPPNSLPISNGAAQNHGPAPIVTLPTALTTASAPTIDPSAPCADAEP